MNESMASHQEQANEREAIDAICKLIDIIKTYHYPEETPKTGAIANFNYSIDFPDKKNKHAFVRYVTLKQNDTVVFQCVIRNQQSNVSTLNNNIQMKSKHYLPKLYKVYEDWAILEKIRGIEQEELQNKLESDLPFRESYAQQTCLLLQTTAADKLALNDVSFVLGHNVKVDPNSATMRLIEQENLHANFVRQTNELIAQQLFQELETISLRPIIVTPKKTGQDIFTNNILGNLRVARVDFGYQLVKLLCQFINPADLYVRPTKIRPTHRKYFGTLMMGNLDYQNSKRMHEKALRESDNTSLQFLGQPNTQLLSEELVNAVRNRDKQAFHSLLLEKKYKTLITDPKDLRASYHVLPDEN